MGNDHPNHTDVRRGPLRRGFVILEMQGESEEMISVLSWRHESLKMKVRHLQGQEAWLVACLFGFL